MDDWHPEALATIADRLGIAFTDLAPPRSQSFRTQDGPNIHVLDWGGQGPPAVLLHGGSLTARTWDYVAIALRADFRLAALDMRGPATPLWCVLRTSPKPFRMIAGRIGDAVDGLSARLLPRQRQHRLHSCDGCLVCVLVAGTGLAHLAVGEACAAPGWLALFCRRVFDHLPERIPSQSLRTASSIDWKSCDPFSTPSMWTVQSSPG